MPLVDRISLGKTGEDLACRELRRRGYEILARRYRTRLGELDIVARDGPTVVFIEVKTRTSTTFGLPSEAVTALKQRRVWLMASDYLQRQGWDSRPCRFDVIEVSMEQGGRARIEVIQAAFDAWE
jgi:putative endonuclease